jgi:TrmH family RNA methyltransferase
VIEPRRWTLADVPVAPGAPVLVLDAVQDPGNVGTILRTALGLGASGVVALKGTAELTSPKVVRGSMGALFRLPAVASEADACLAWARERGVELWVAAADGTPLGNEGAGVGPLLGEAASRRVAIRLTRGVESLNVAVVAAILLREVARVD